jgi:hypothetical protein
MAVPNDLATIQAVYAAGSYNLSTHDGCGKFVEASCIALHAKDPRWGHLKKTGGTQYNGHSHDGCLYLSDTPGQSVHVDMIASAEAPGAYVYWNPDIPRYSASDWYAPSGAPVPGPGPTPGPACPDPSRHKPVPYIGDPTWDQFGVIITADFARAGQSLNAQAFRWAGRTLWDCTFGDETGKVLTLSESTTKHRKEWCDALGIPVQ